MFRTEVIKSKNLRKTLFFKIYNGVSILLFLILLVILTKLYPENSAFGEFISNNYTNVIQPSVMAIALVLIIMSIFTRNASKNPKRIGSLELNSDEVRFLIDDEVQEIIKIDDVDTIDFEFFSFRMRGNPMGGMNYLTFHLGDESKQFEIVIANTIVKAQLGEILKNINNKIPVNVKYAYFLKQIFKDSDFKFETK